MLHDALDGKCKSEKKLLGTSGHVLCDVLCVGVASKQDAQHFHCKRNYKFRYAARLAAVEEGTVSGSLEC